jgi:photosystem II stability/assembly factor-like uncharacterized protein
MKRTMLLPAISLVVLCIGSMKVHAQSGWFWQNPLPQGNTLNGVHFSNDLIGMAVGEDGTIIRTTDRGLSWIRKKSQTLNDLMNVFLIDENNCVVIGYNGTILRSTNGGESWTSQPSSTNQTLFGISFINQMLGIIVGSN